MKAPVATSEEMMKEDQPSETPEAMMDEGAMEEQVVVLTASGFEPNTITIKAGEKIVWKNESGKTATVNSDPHPIHTDYSPLNLGNFDDGGSLSLVFQNVGTYTYHNHLNPSQKGTVVIE